MIIKKFKDKLRPGNGFKQVWYGGLLAIASTFLLVWSLSSDFTVGSQTSNAKSAQIASPVDAAKSAFKSLGSILGDGVSMIDDSFNGKPQTSNDDINFNDGVEKFKFKSSLDLNGVSTGDSAAGSSYIERQIKLRLKNNRDNKGNQYD